MPKVYILILNYNSWKDTIECLESVFRLNYSNFQVVVVDNHSPNQSMDYIIAWAEGKNAADILQQSKLPEIHTEGFPKPIPYAFFDAREKEFVILPLKNPLTLIQAGTNFGFAHGNNLFLQKVSEEDAFVWLLNPDMVIQPGTLTQFVEATYSHQQATVWGGMIHDYTQPEKVSIRGGGKIHWFSGTVTMLHKRNQSPDYIHGGCFFTHLSNFKKVGLLPEQYFLYWEESDWCYRAEKKGIEMKVSDLAICYDKGGTSIGRGYLAEYYYSLNALKFIGTYRRELIFFVFFFNILRIFRRLFSGNLERARAIFQASVDFIKKKPSQQVHSI